MGFIYKITNNVNGKVYIGKTQRTIEIRWKEHQRDCFNKDKDNKLYRAIRKYGIENFSVEKIEYVDDSELSYKESYYIKKYNSFYEGYNLTFGGDGESTVDFSVIEKLYKTGMNCTEISKETGHTTKTISNLLKGHGYKIKHASKYNKNGKQVIFEDRIYSSYKDLAIHLINTKESFKNKRLLTVIQYISKNIVNGVFDLNVRRRKNKKCY